LHIQSADFAQGVLYDGCLMNKLSAVVQVLQTAPTTAQKDGAFCADTFFRGRKNFFRLTIPDISFDFKHLETDFFTRQARRHEKGDAVVFDNAFTV
jgi:hypothetical protein